MAGKGGGAWKVAYADFVTAMMAFFMVMWITAQNKAVKESIAQYFQNPLGKYPEPRATSIHGIEGASGEAPLEGFQAGPHGTDQPGVGSDAALPEDTKGLNVPPTLRIFERLDRTREVGTIVLFTDLSTELDEAGRQQLRMLVPQLLGKPNKVELRGHADVLTLSQRPQVDMWELCLKRCLAVMNYLIELGVEPDRFRLSQDGIFEPYSREERLKFQQFNSRVEVYAVSEFRHAYRESIQERAGEYLPAGEAPPDPHAEAQPPATDNQNGHAAGNAGGHGAPAAAGHGVHAQAGGHSSAHHGAKDAHAPQAKVRGQSPHTQEKNAAHGPHGKSSHPSKQPSSSGHGEVRQSSAKKTSHSAGHGH
ncbi:MAG: hypothetical protein KatS3mg113_0027 [Planctomycetaceae bacterium]|nr:MAG: hypothetical protein KatS3mg113_0027 [Planctomycetaceae bacterium]